MRTIVAEMEEKPEIFVLEEQIQKDNGRVKQLQTDIAQLNR
jgi:hypothetical protein